MQELRARFRLRLLLWAVATLAWTGCSEPEQPVVVAQVDGVVSAETAHSIEQEAIEACMRRSGFDFIAPAFSDRGGQLSAEGRLRLADADAIGYAGVFRSVEFLTPGGEPGPDVPASEYEAYAAALNGRGLNFDVHDHDDDMPDDHSHDHQEGHLGEARHLAEHSGCYAVGAYARQELEVEEGELDLSDLRARLQSSDEYKEFADAWSTCLAEAGFQLRSDDPVTHSLQASVHFFDEAQTRMVAIFSEGGPVADHYRAQHSARQKVDLAWFASIVERDEGLSEIFHNERQEAIADEKCRSATIAPIEPMITS